MNILIRAARVSAPILLACGMQASLHAQQGPLTEFRVEGFVYEPEQLAPTDARVASLQLPAGLTIHRFAEGLDNPRILATAPDGSVYVTQRTPGNIVMLRDVDRDGIADIQRIVYELPQAHGLWIRGTDIYFTDVKNVYQGLLRSDGSIENVRPIVQGLPDGGQHPNRTIAFSPQDELFVTVGSTCNECIEPNPENATILKVRHGWDRRIFASGLRNTIGFGWHPVSGKLFGFDQGIDWLGNDEQSEEVNEIVDGKIYGWPFVYDEDQINPHVEPRLTTSEDWALKSEEPLGLYTPHSAAMQLQFYTGTQLPAEYRNDALVAMRGSWNRKPASGYELVRARFDASGEFQAVEPFVTGFLQPLPAGGDGFFARPVGVTIAQDGAVLLGDDTNNTLYRIATVETAGTPTPQQLAFELFDAPNSIAVTSPVLQNGAAIPRRYSAYDKGVAPAIGWGNLPAGTRTVVLLMEDPDAIAPLPFVHWSLIDVPPEVAGVPEELNRNFQPLPGQPARQGSSSISDRGYFGPRPPKGDPPHRYHFQVFALDTFLKLEPGFNRHALISAMQGHVLAKGLLVGTYQEPIGTPAGGP